MKETPASDPRAGPDEIDALVRTLRETEQRLQQLMDGEVDAVVLLGGQSYLFQEAQERLRQSEERFRNIFSAAATGIAISTPDGYFLRVNAPYCRMLGYTEAELLTQNFAELTHPDDLHLNLELRDDLLAGRRATFIMEKRYIHKGGGIVWARHSVAATHTNQGEIDTLIAVAEDITARKLAEFRLQRLNRLHAVLSKTGDAIVRTLDRQVLYDKVCRIIVDEGLMRMVFIAEVDAAARVARPAASAGEGLDYLLGPTNIIPMDGGSLSRGTVGTALRTGHPDICNDIPNSSRMKPWHLGARKYGLVSNASFPLELRGTVVGVLVLCAGEADYFLDDEIRLMVKVAGDISFALETMEKEQDRRRAEEALNLKQARYQRLVDSNIQGVIFWNRNGTITGANDAFLRLVRRSREDLEAGRIDWIPLTPPEFAHLDRRSLAEIDAKGFNTPYEKEFVLDDGTRVPILLGAASFPDNPNEGVCFILDLTERKKLEQQFFRAQRMESIGTLAGGIAHDLNNILAPILMSIELLKGSARDAESRGILDMIELSAQRGADIVRQVLTFARGVKSERTEVQPQRLLKDLQHFLKDTFPKDIQLKFSIPANPWMIFGDSTQVNQILLNLCVNARDAMPRGGNLTIGVENCVLDELSYAMNLDAKPGNYVKIDVTDSGVGMAREVIDKIFEPFFTTKDINHGTGLGLSTVMAIVKSHDGIVTVYSEPGKGTTVKVYLPAVGASCEAGRAQPEEAGLAHGKGETILVVDDEVSILSIIGKSLHAFGYRVLTASDGGEGLAVYARHMDSISVVLTDMTMPGMDGSAMIQALRRINPEVVVIAASGLDVNGHRGSIPGVERFLTKPYTARTLLTVLRTILDKGETDQGERGEG